MFTGIIEEVGTILSIRRGARSATIYVTCRDVLVGTKIGDSIAVNGVCLTVTTIDSTGFSADVMDETIDKSSLSIVSNGDKVNLERAMSVDGRFGGHIVAGHVDATATIRDIKKGEMAIVYTIDVQAEMIRYIVKKGSIAVDGISLTVASVDAQSFTISVIPHTISHTTLVDKRPGDIVNIETDIVGKYIEKLITPNDTSTPQSKGKGLDITEEFLIKHGF